MRFAPTVLVLVSGLALVSGAAAVPPPLRLVSPSFGAGGTIPVRHTCDGADRSPALRWFGAPARTRSFALIVEDPDAPDPRAPKTTWTHWVLYDLPAGAASLPESVGTRALPNGTREGLNDWKQTGYRGPCPPIGRHRYVHRLFALDTRLPDLHQPTRAQLLAALQGHVLATTELTATYAHH